MQDGVDGSDDTRGRSPTDPPSTEDVNVAHSSRPEVAGDTYVWERWILIDGAK